MSNTVPGGRRRRVSAGPPVAQTFRQPVGPRDAAEPFVSDEDSNALDEDFDAVADDASLEPLDAERRHRMVSDAAYFLAEQRGFADGNDMDDWLRAESQIDQRA